MHGELNVFLGELVGMTCDELVFDLRDRSLAPARKWNGANLRFGIGGHSDEGVDVVHGLAAPTSVITVAISRHDPMAAPIRKI